MTPGTSKPGGFTLVEAMITIAITGVLAAVVAVFIRAPIVGYQDVARRADLTDTADTALQRIGRDLRAALPNSVRVIGACAGNTACFLEYIPVVTGGRYRAGPVGNILDFTTNDTAFDVIGPAVPIPAGSLWLVVYNLGIPGADAYSGAAAATDVRRAYSGGTGNVTSIAFTSANRLPFESPSRRFQIVSEPVTYECVPGAGTLVRHTGYGFIATHAAVAPSAGPARLAGNVSRCRFTYQTGGTQLNALVTLELALTRDGETVTLINQIHVSNAP